MVVGFQPAADPVIRPRDRHRSIPVATAVVASLILLGLVSSALGHLGVLERFDDRVVLAVNRWVTRHHGSLAWLRIVARLGSPICQDALAALGAGVLLLRGRGKIMALFCGMVIGGQGLWFALSRMIDRPRPVVPDPVAFGVGGSLPSGHTSVTTVVTGSLLVAFALVLGRWPGWGWSALALAWVCLVGCTRVALGVHFPSDVLAGWALGLLVGSVGELCARRWFTSWERT